MCRHAKENHKEHGTENALQENTFPLSWYENVAWELELENKKT